jgi:hypothetical protein
MPRTAAKTSLVVLSVLIALPILAYGLLCKTAWGRDLVRTQANRLVSHAMAGNLEIAHLDELNPPYLRARGVKITDPKGGPCIEVNQIEAWLDLSAIMGGTFAWDRAFIRGGIVHVLEDSRGRVNMEETFAAPPASASDGQGTSDAPPESGDPPRDLLDLRTMMTSDMVLVIGGGSLPSLRMEDIRGTMRVHVLPDENVELRFDDYSGDFVKGLPTGRLQFRDVKGYVQNVGARLLRFEGQGKSEGAPVEFVLDIHTEPKQQVEIDAHFRESSLESISTGAFALWTKFVPSLDLRVHRESLFTAGIAKHRLR